MRGPRPIARTSARIATCAFAVEAALAAAWPAANAQTADADTAEAGRRIYVSSCQRCHGINLVTNGIGFDLRTFPENDKARFVRSVTNGLRAMPAWGATLKPEQMDLVWAYIGSVNGWKAAPGPQ
jgi:mono/diheme cytochrome c family protein